MQNTEIEHILKNIFKEKFIKNFPLSEYVSFKCGGNAKYFIYPENIKDVIKIVEISKRYNENILIIGKGTNILVSDYGFDGIVISTLKMKNLIIKDDKIECECGVEIRKLLKMCIENSLSGVEFLAGIPGTIGGAVKNNAGLKKEWISERINYVEYLDLENFKVVKKEKKEIFFDYRKSEFGNNSFIWKTEIFLNRDKKYIVKKNIENCIKERIRKQPLGFGAGSIFKNPYPYYAGELIEKCGLKGYSVGNCYVSEKHANFIINKGKGKAQEVYELIKIIKNKVKEKFNIDLELEIQLIGEFK